MNKRDYKIMEFLKRQAIDNDYAGNAKIASAIVFKNQIISIGRNQRRSHPFQRKYAKHSLAIYLHSETDSIKKALNHLSITQLSKANLYIYRVKRPNGYTNTWIPGMARPCCGCIRAIIEFNLKKVFYSTEHEGVFESL